MADFAVEVVRIKEPVEDHPDADRLSIIKIGGYVTISAKLEDGSHRYKQGDLVVYVPEGALVPEWALKRYGFWDVGKDRGLLSGSACNRVKAKKLRGVFSQGLLFPVGMTYPSGLPYGTGVVRGEDKGDEANETFVNEGDNVAEFLGIVKYEPKVPQSMAGRQGALFGVTLKYDFESIQRVTELFEPGEQVVVTEKIHGTNIQIGYVPGAYPEGEDFYVTSKGIGAKGFNLKDVPENDGNLYVRIFRQLRERGVLERMKALSARFPDLPPVRLYGEVFGKGIQDLSYGQTEPTLMVFDIQLGETFLRPHDMLIHAEILGVDPVPVLYRGPYDLEAIVKHRDGKTVLGAGHIREGVVITSMSGARHPKFGRKIGKWISPDYLLRQNATEFA